jgi:putative nucleotidyltransferase with HDIG domain
VTVEISTYPVKIMGRTLVLGIARDITERKKAEQQIKQGYKKLQRTMEATINTISKIIEARDPYAAGHQLKVSKLANSIAQEMKLPEDKIEGMRIAALVHDIGKINIPAEILSKPSKLNEMEFSLIKNHPKTGYDILKTIDFPWPVARIVLQHHEKIDGSGYPQGQKSNKILLEAKIIGVADVVEAMSSHRPYRPALGIDKALEEISQNRGILYDPEVTDACLKLFKEKGFKFEL